MARFLTLLVLVGICISNSEDIKPLLEPIDGLFDESPLSNAEIIRRRMQFTTTTSGPPTEPPSMPPTPLGSTLAREDTNPYIYVDFGQHISYDSANTFCVEQLGTHLAAVDKLQEDRLNQTEQINLMVEMCQGSGDANHYDSDHADCWIGLEYNPIDAPDTTTLFEWENGQSLNPSETFWRPGTNTPTAFTFISGETTVC